MSFEPEPGTRIHLKNDEVIEFLPLEASGPASVFVYAESGKEGTVYKVLKNQDQYALKVFYPPYRDKRLLENTDKLHRFKDLEGFRVAKRTVITPETFPTLLDKYPDLNYAVLMPWIDGTVWGNMMSEPAPSLQLDNYVQIAHALTRVVSHLERQGLAHCDLSNNNFIIAESPAGIQLIDIEDMYAPDMPRPIPDVSYGSIGYRTKWIAEKGLWGPASDRFSMAVLCSEIITWHHEEIRENKYGITSFFDEEEIGEQSDRFKLMVKYLSCHSDDLPALLEKAWFSTDFEQCPTVTEWREAVRKLKAQVAPEPSPYMEDQSGIATLSIRDRSLKDRGPVETAPEPEPPAVEEAGPLTAPVIVDPDADEINEDVQDQAAPQSEVEHPSQEAEEQLQPDWSVVEKGAEQIDHVVQEPAFLEPEAERPPEEAEEQFQAELAVEEKDADEIQPVVREQTVLKSEAERPAEAVKAEIQSGPVVPEQIEATIPVGVPPKMNISVEILDFGIVGKPENSQRFSISNSGGAVLNVSIHADDWIDLSQRDFALLPGEQQLITASLNVRFPRPKTGLEYRTPGALTIESNTGSEVISAKFSLAKPGFYESWWKRALLGTVLGSIVGCLLVPLAFASDMTALVIVPMVILLGGAAGVVTFPSKSSNAFLILGFVLAEILALALIVLLDLGEIGAVILGLGAGMGFLGGAIASRVFLTFRRADTPLLNK
jgi:serine/threonine protein kinase